MARAAHDREFVRVGVMCNGDAGRYLIAHFTTWRLAVIRPPGGCQPRQKIPSA